NCAQHLSKELVRCRRSRENIQAVSQCLYLAAGDLLGGAQRSLRAIAFNRDPHKVRRQVDQFEVPRVRTPPFAIVHTESSKDFSGEESTGFDHEARSPCFSAELRCSGTSHNGSVAMSETM